MDPKRNRASWVRVESSNLHSVIWYEDRQGTPWLGVRFGGQPLKGPQPKKPRPITTYDYRGVGEDVYKALLAAGSKGEFHAAHIKGKYDFVGPT